MKQSTPETPEKLFVSTRGSYKSAYKPHPTGDLNFIVLEKVIKDMLWLFFKNERYKEIDNLKEYAMELLRIQVARRN